MSKKKVLALVCALAMAVMAFAACGNDSTSTAAPPAGGGEPSGPAAPAETDWEFERAIELVCPWGAGGGADTTLRAFADALGKELDVPINVVNKTGAGGATGIDYAIKQPADGYTWVLNTQSTILAQLTGATDVQVYENVRPVTRLVHDVNIIVTGSQSPYNDLGELLDYVEANPGEVKAGCMSVTGLDGLTVEITFEGAVEAVGYTEGSQLNADLMGGHIQLGIVGPAEVEGLVASGDLKVLAVCAENRMTIAGFDNAPTTVETGIPESVYGPARGIFCHKDTPEAAVQAFAAAAEKAVKSDAFQQWCASQGLDQRPGYMGPDEYQVWWDEQWSGLQSILANIEM